MGKGKTIKNEKLKIKNGKGGETIKMAEGNRISACDNEAKSRVLQPG